MTTPAPAWTTDELATLGAADEVQLAVRRADGTLRRPVTIWIVRVGDDLFVRSVNGPSAVWYRSVEEQRAGHLEAAGISRDVALEPVGPALADQIDAAYRSKYGHYPASYVNAIIAPQAREATLRVLPR
jgi:hypothetical protein